MTHRLLLNSPFDIQVKTFFDSAAIFQPAVESKIPHPVDVYENKGGLHLEIACTGLTKEQIDISLEGDVLRISYEKKQDEKCCEVNDCKYIHKGISKKSFNLGYKIASKYDLAKADAEMNNGLLTISIPFTKESTTKVLKIK